MAKRRARNQNFLKGWSPLKSQDLIDVIAPASRCPQNELDAGVKVLESWGLNVRVPEDLFGDELLHANSDQARWRQLKSALMARDSRALWCARGGYGSMKLLPALAKLKIPKQPKIFLGLSDMTSLNVFFIQKWKWPVLHAPILSRVGRGDLPVATINELKQVLFGEINELHYELEPLNALAEKKKMVKGQLVGGNWTTLMAAIGTPFQLQPKGSILFIEDRGERGYRLDRYWEQLLQMGFLDQIEALVIGDLTEGKEPDGRDLIWDVVKARARKLKKPVYHGIPSGHGLVQRVLPLGVPALVVREQNKIVVSAPTGMRQ